MKFEYPLVLKDRDGFVYRIDTEKDLGWVEAIDVEDGEYKAWDASGQILRLIAEGITWWKAASFRVEATGQFDDPSKIAALLASAEPP